MTPIHHPRMSHPFQGEGTPCGPKGRGDCDKSPFPRRGGGTVLSHPKKGWGGDRDESPKEGWGDRDESSKRGVSQGGLHQSQSRGGGGGQIMLMWGQSPYPTTHGSSGRMIFWRGHLSEVHRAYNIITMYNYYIFQLKLSL